LRHSFDALFLKCHGAFNQVRTWSRAKDLAHGILSCMGRSTITGWLVSSGLQFRDWSASYKLFSQNRINIDGLFTVIRQEVVSMNDRQDENIYAHMDDTLFRKRGKKVSGAKWLRDPLGPPFNTNFVWGQRFLQISLSCQLSAGAVQSKTIPIDLIHCPLPVKPKKNSDEAKTMEYKEHQKKMKLSKIGYERINMLRENLDSDGHTSRRLVLSVDGSFTNETVLKNLEQNITLIGRIRKDARLNTLPVANEKGRKRVYGETLPTPEQIRQSENYHWQEVEAWACGKVRTFNVKIVNNVRWRKAGATNLKLIIIRPVAYRLSKNSNRLYRDPIYLICTDTELSIEKLLQAYLRRWGIEVNFKEQKTFLGCGKAQVRTKESCQNVPAFHTAVYSILLTASAHGNHQELPRPKWYRKNKISPPTTGDILNQFQAACWAENKAMKYNNFIKLEEAQRSHKNPSNPSLSAVLYRRN
jgi:hypothetical protein